MGGSAPSCAARDLTQLHPAGGQEPFSTTRRVGGLAPSCAAREGLCGRKETRWGGRLRASPTEFETNSHDHVLLNSSSQVSNVRLSLPLIFYAVCSAMAEPAIEQTDACQFLRKNDPFFNYRKCFNCRRQSTRSKSRRTKDVVRDECAFRGSSSFLPFTATHR